MSHYFKNDDTIKTKINTFKINYKNNNFTFKTDSGVFSKAFLDYGSNVLLNSTVINNDETKILDLGCGYGPIGIILGKLYPNKLFHMVDVNDRAVNLAKENAILNDVSNVDIYSSFIFENINTKFDLILTNPPIRAGKDIVFKFYEQSFNHLNDNGRLLVVIQRKQGAPSTLKKLEELFSNVKIITKDKGYWIIEAIKHILID